MQRLDGTGREEKGYRVVLVEVIMCSRVDCKLSSLSVMLQDEAEEWQKKRTMEQVRSLIEAVRSTEQAGAGEEVDLRAIVSYSCCSRDKKERTAGFRSAIAASRMWATSPRFVSTSPFLMPHGTSNSSFRRTMSF